jgi:hypothetical protein
MIDQPQYPSVQGQGVPDLGLAQYSVSTPQTAIYTNSDSTGPDMCDPPPLGEVDIPGMGIDPGVPKFDLELANEQPVATPGQLAGPAGSGSVNTPTFAMPDMSVPALKSGDLTGPGIDQAQEFEPDPQTGDLLNFDKPGGLTTIAAWNVDPMDPDPMAPDLDEYDRPDGLSMPAPMTPDPTLPDLQSPQLEQDVHMSGRPGDLATDALDEMHQDASYQQLPDTAYNASYMQQGGDNQRRERHLGLMYNGLDDEEKD